MPVNNQLSSAQIEFLESFLGEDGSSITTILEYEKLDLGTKIEYLERSILYEGCFFYSDLDQIYDASLTLDRDKLANLELVRQLKFINDICFNNTIKYDEFGNRLAITHYFDKLGGSATPECFKVYTQTIIRRRIINLIKGTSKEIIESEITKRLQKEVLIHHNLGWRKILDLPVWQQVPYLGKWHSKYPEFLEWLFDLKNLGMISGQVIARFEELGSSLALCTARVMEALAWAELTDNRNFNAILNVGSANLDFFASLIQTLRTCNLASQENFDAILQKHLSPFHLADLNKVLEVLPSHLRIQRNLNYLLKNMEAIMELPDYIEKIKNKIPIQLPKHISSIIKFLYTDPKHYTPPNSHIFFKLPSAENQSRSKNHHRKFKPY